MKPVLRALNGFFFAPIPALGFGMMRSAWAAVNLFFMACQWQDVTLYYSEAGYFPQRLIPDIVRADYRFTLLDYITHPGAVWALYLLLLLALFCMMIGLRARLATWISVILLFSFQEHTFFMFAGGDTLLRALGFYLALAPTLKAFSVDRAWQQWKYWKQERVLLPQLTMPIWPYRLVLWQFIIIYCTAAWYKTLDAMWRSGSGVAVSLHDVEFTRFRLWVSNTLTPITGLLDYMTLLMQMAWVLLLIPRHVRAVFVPSRLRRYSLKRVLIYSGFLFHFGILVLLDAGSFSLAMFTGYLGLLLTEDFEAFRTMANRRLRGLVTVLYDGHCRFCVSSVFWLLLLDNLHRVHAVDFRDPHMREQEAGDLPLKQLEKAIHVRFPGGKTLKGFHAVRALLWQLPGTWLLAPFLYLPGAAWLGSRAYAYVAAHRSCVHGACRA